MQFSTFVPFFVDLLNMLLENSVSTLHGHNKAFWLWSKICTSGKCSSRWLAVNKKRTQVLCYNARVVEMNRTDLVNNSKCPKAIFSLHSVEIRHQDTLDSLGVDIYCVHISFANLVVIDAINDSLCCSLLLSCVLAGVMFVAGPMSLACLFRCVPFFLQTLRFLRSLSDNCSRQRPWRRTPKY